MGYRGFKYFSHQYKVKSIYNKAEQLMINNDYSNAADLLYEIIDEGYRDTYDYLTICNSHIAYESNNFLRAYVYIKHSNILINIHNEQIRTEYEAYKEKVYEAYHEWSEMNAEQEREKQLYNELKESREQRKKENTNKRSSKFSKKYHDTDKHDSYDRYDPYNAYEYSDPEDFYYDNEEDFLDYVDAEDYWYSVQE